MLDPTIHGVRQIRGPLLCCHFTKEYHGDVERQEGLQINKIVLAQRCTCDSPPCQILMLFLRLLFLSDGRMQSSFFLPV